MMGGVGLARVPVIDLGHEQVVEQVRRACEDVGFLVVTGHGIPNELLERMGAVSRAFFDLPEPVKAVHHHPERGARYVPLASESVAASLDLVTPPDLNEAYSVYRRDTEEWPPEPVGMRDVWREYHDALAGLAARVMRIFALALGLDENWFDDKIDHADASLWVTNYPAQLEEPQPGQLRAGPHTDYDTLTLLKVEDVPGGLQVEVEPGVWADVPYVRGSYVVNIGDLMSRWTNDRWVSTMHRVANPPPGSGPAARRQSIVFFHKPNDDAVIAPIPSCVGAEGPRYPPVLAGSYVASKGRKQDAGHECASALDLSAADPRALDDQLRHNGFLLVGGHGVDLDLIRRTRAMAARFFALDDGAKSAFRPVADGAPGYYPVAAGSLARTLGEDGPPDVKESFTTGPLRTCDDPVLARWFPETRWPTVCGFAETWSAYHRAMEGLADRLLALFARALDLPGNPIAAACRNPTSTLSAVHYPGGGGRVRAGAHSDYGTCTILHKQPGADDLEVRMPDGSWSRLRPTEDVFVVNTGDLLARWTNDRWVSPVHRVVETGRASLSLGYFHQPDADAVVAALPGCVTPDRPARHPPVLAGDYLAERMTRQHTA